LQRTVRAQVPVAHATTTDQANRGGIQREHSIQRLGKRLAGISTSPRRRTR
jgi:uncharacterized protein (DUF1810 family)